MSVKRQATTELNHENWDQDDPSEHEEMGSFKAASNDVLQKRVIRTAKRRSHLQSTPLGSPASNEETKKTVFSGFGGFNKTQPSSFDFLSKLTNGNKNPPLTAPKTDSPVTSPAFNNTPLSNNSSNGIFGSRAPTESPSKSVFGVPSTQTSSMFGSTATQSNAASSVFSTSKSNVTAGLSPFKMPLTGNTSDTNKDKEIKTTSVPSSSSKFGGPSNTNNTSKLFTETPKTSLFGSNSISNTNTTQSNSGSLFTSSSKSENVEKATEKPNEKKSTYYLKLNGLNVSVSRWIKKHVEETPLCILSPIFKDYDKYLKEIQDEYHGDSKKTEDKPVTNNSTFSSQNNTSSKSTAFASGENDKISTSNSPVQSALEKPKTTGFGFIPSPSQNSSLPVSSPFSTTTNTSSNAKPFSFGIGKSTTGGAEEMKTTGFGTLSSPPSTTTSISSPFTTNTTSNGQTPFSFGIGKSNTGRAEEMKTTGFGTLSSPSSTTSISSPFATNTTTSGQTPFSFGIGKSTTGGAEQMKTTGFGTLSSPPSTTSISSPFATNTTSNGQTPFSFGVGKPFSFKSNIQAAQSTPSETNENEDEDTPPKVEFNPIVEENSVYEKRCKVFEKKDGNFVDKGVGTLYIKKIEDNGKHQLLIRANTSLGKIMVNLILADAIPTQRMGKNNVMMVCIPTPDSKPPPVPMLIRVKTSEEADELLETLNKYKT